MKTRQSSPSRSMLRISAFVLFALALMNGLSRSQAQGNRPEQSPRGFRGQAAINRLGARLPQVAFRYNLTPDRLRQIFQTDYNLWVDNQDTLVFLDEFVPQQANAPSPSTSPAAQGPLPHDQTFLLHSLPGASKVIYLDFDGHTTIGTPWNNNGSPIVSAPFDLDGAPSSWSNTELDRIQYIWQRVAEDFLPFGVDVTTQDPGVEWLRKTSSDDEFYGVRVVISPTNWYNPNAGGVAYVGSFNWNSDTPCFAFTGELGAGYEKYTAEAISHEAGHTVGLYHDGRTGGTAYYEGHANWAPIMGVGYYEEVTQWSKGEYALANNAQDDLTVMTGYGFTYRTDDHGGAIGSASPLTITNSTHAGGKGIIERTADKDYFSFLTGAGRITLNVTPGPRSPNLDIRADLLDAGGALVASSNPNSLSASISVTVAGGIYYLAIDGVGTGDPSAGYSDYASLGEFNISGTIIDPGATQAPISMHAGDLDGASSAAQSGKWNATVTITAHTPDHTPISGVTISGAWSSSGSGSCTTGAAGKCGVTLNNTRKTAGSVTFTVNGMTLSGYAYSSSANHDPDGDSNGTTITVAKP